MTKRQDLYLQRRSRSEQSDQRQPNQAKNISHQPRASPNSTPLTSRIEFPTMTGWQESCEAPTDGYPAAALVAAPKLLAPKAGILWTRPKPGVADQTENASIASGFEAATMSTN